MVDDKLFARYNSNGSVKAIMKDGKSVWEVGKTYNIPDDSQIISAKLTEVKEEDGKFILHWRKQ